MIQLGPLELNSATIETPVGVKTGRYRTLSTGQEQTLSEPTHTLRLRVRLEISDPVYPQLIQMVRNKHLIALPLYSGYQYIDGLYVVKTLRENPINWRWNEIALVLQHAGHYFMKNQDSALRFDDWNTIYSEDFDPSFTAPMLNEAIFDHESAIASSTAVTPVIGANHGLLSGDRDVIAALFGFDYWKNYHVSCWVQASSNYKFGLIWRAETGNIEGFDEGINPGNSYGDQHRGRHYELLVDPVNEKYVVEYHTSWDPDEDTTTTIFEETQDSLDYDQWYHLQVITVGNYHFCLANGRMITYFKDTNCKGGRPGFILRDDTSASLYIDNVIVQEVPSSVLVLDESYSEPQGEIIKTRDTLYGTIAYCEEQQITHKVGSGGVNCILHLRFDQKYGEKVFDLSPFQHHAQIRGGQWKDGYMRFQAGTKGLNIPYNSDISNTAEGTVIIRMRTNSAPTGEEAIIRRGTTDWSIYMDDTDSMMHASSEEPGSTAAGTSPATFVPDLIPNGEFRTYVIRWHKANQRMDIFCDGKLAGADFDQLQDNYGSSTTSDMRIGEANVDIEYILVYNKWIEQPSVPGAIGAGIYDVDPHHEDEIFDLRINEAYNREFWNDLALTEVGSPTYQDQDSKPLLYRRNGASMDTSNHLTMALPDHLKNHFHAMDWTIELIFASGNTATPAGEDILTIGNSTFDIKNIRVHVSELAGIYTIRRSIVAGATQTGIIREYDDSDHYGLQIIHMTYRAATRELRSYFHGVQTEKAILTGDIDSTWSTHLRFGHAPGLYYRVRIIGKALRPLDIRILNDQYIGKSTQVFGEHEFKGYPEASNGLLTIRPRVSNIDNEHGEQHIAEMFDNGTFILAEGDVSGTTQPIELLNLVANDEGNNTHGFRIWDLQPIVKLASHDEAVLEFRVQCTIRNPQLIQSGLHMRTKVGIAAGLFTLDLHSKLTTRTTDWEQRYRYHDMQACWREGGHTPQGETVESDCRGNFMAASGHTTGTVMDSSASAAHLSNLTVFTNLGTVRDYIIGLLPEHTDDYIYVPILTGDDIIESFHFDDLHEVIGGEFRVSIGLVPYSAAQLFDDPDDTVWTASNMSNVVDTDALNDKHVANSATLTVASIYKDITFEPGTWQVWWGIYGTGSAGDIAVRVYETGSPIVFRNFRNLNYQLSSANPQMFQDMPFVLNETIDTLLRLEIRMRDDENAGGSYKFDGVCFIPCYNGADFILDQLYSARALKNIRRYPH